MKKLIMIIFGRCGHYYFDYVALPVLATSYTSVSVHVGLFYPELILQANKRCVIVDSECTKCAK